MSATAFEGRQDQMAEFDFDEVIDRRGTHSAKWDGMAARTGVSALGSSGNCLGYWFSRIGLS